MFKSPHWASLIDVKTADGVVEAVSSVRLAPYGLPAPVAEAPVINPANQAPAGALAAALAGALAAQQAPAPAAQAQGNTPAPHSYGSCGVEAVARHARNITLCEAMYPVLHMLEVVMRNRIHNAFSQHFGALDWYEQAWLNANHARLVSDARTELTKRNRPHHPDRVVAELSFGFWCGMFHFAYENGRRAAWPALLGTVLPGVPKSWRTRAKVQKRVEAARALRNRVFHHEPVTFHQDLRDRHRHLIEVLGWFSPEARQHIEQICRFDRVHDDNLCLTPPAQM
ncbi:hypothetical protein FJU31_04710 [Stenotrophomonas cyclobalanopsidis]|uniref:Abi family protein n=1 Tax=Stenotrophomonas cyclobalanopsidis TaxID=2771362 RepID=A0ABQ6T3U4_9GAMM|nr:hypothetical protein [Stenotrophomonas cyclobalanopsidis]KAA9002181.1 hypothetical protein FJU31_04710 [Stenotrophomonas cyclobalanopsidis]